jgi:nicotinate-nucleotide--dimethylbenzimidazole phosphoribosyltransferase
MFKENCSAKIQQRIDQKTKPPGSLGLLEDVAHQLALIQSIKSGELISHIEINQPTAILFAGDHGIADEGISIAPCAVTQQMVLNFLAGGAAINSFCSINNISLKVVDCGILVPVETDSEDLIKQRLGDRTNNFTEQAAMSDEQVQQGIALGKAIVNQTIASGSNLVMFGEMGIGNTSSAAAILAALSEQAVEKCVGLGTGISTEQLQKKVQVVGKGVARCLGGTPYQVLAEVGGYELVQMVGAFLAAYENKTAVIVDGFIVSTAAYVATLIEPGCREYMIFAHRSQESGHKILLDLLQAKPLLDLELRLGEGTGAALAVSLLRAAAEFYNHMASFASAGVTV